MLAPSQGLRNVPEFFHACAHRAEDQEQRFRVCLSSLLGHIQVRGLNAVEPGQLKQFPPNLSVGPFLFGCALSGLRFRAAGPLLVQLPSEPL